MFWDVWCCEIAKAAFNVLPAFREMDAKIECKCMANGYWSFVCMEMKSSIHPVSMWIWLIETNETAHSIVVLQYCNVKSRNTISQLMDITLYANQMIRHECLVFLFSHKIQSYFRFSNFVICIPNRANRMCVCVINKWIVIDRINSRNYVWFF